MAGPRTRHGSFILLRRLRWPLILLIIVYATSVLGFALIPGVGPDGRPWRMSFLHAFYFVSFLGTTIGLGEIPHPFSDAQRLWATASIYATVIAWLYAIGSLFAVLRDPLFRRISHETGVYREVRRLREPFYLLCGYDDTGYRLVRELTEDSVRVVVIDVEPTRVDAIDVDEHSSTVPALVGDASDPKALVIAGLTLPQCQGVIALTGSDNINTKVTITARLLAPKLPVLSVARDHRWQPRLAAAGTDTIINPFDTFAERVAISIRTPSLHVIYEALTTQAGTAAAEAPKVPRGRWVLCGWGLFSRTLRRQLQSVEVEVFVVDTVLDESCDDSNSLIGDPTDPDVLRRAGVEGADALVAGTAVDIDNLAVVLAGREINKRLYIVARQTQRRNTAVFHAAPIDQIMLSSYVVAGEMLRHLRDPLLSAFLRRARAEDEAWAAGLLAQLRESVGGEVLESWSMSVSPASLPAACDALSRGEVVTLDRLLTRMDGSMDRMRALPLLLQRGRERRLLPGLLEPLQPGDQVLFCGREKARARMRGIALTRSLAPIEQRDNGATAASNSAAAG
jgi:Trk K+ transport system NAD-binding subunit